MRCYSAENSGGTMIKTRIKQLIDYTNTMSYDGRTALMLAVVNSDLSRIQELIDLGADVNTKDKDGNTALLLATRYTCDQDQVLRSLIRARSDVNCQDNEGLSPLMMAAKYSDPDNISLLLDSGADVNAKDKDGNTALLLAAHYKRDQDQVLRSLIRAGSDVNCQNNEGMSPLMMAATYSDANNISLLLDSGADVNSVSNKDKTKTALSVFLKQSYFDINKTGCLELLLDKGASSSYLSPEILHRKIIRRERKIIPKLIQRGLGPADVKADYLGLRYLGFTKKIPFVSPLCVALIVGNVALALYFVENLFLTASDVTFLKNYTDVRLFSQTHNRQKCLNFLDKVFSQPMSLFSLAFVSVISSLAPGPGREDRVNLLPLPQKIKDKLLFQTEQVKAGVSEADEAAESESPIRVRRRHSGYSRRRVLFTQSETLDINMYLDLDSSDDGLYIF